MTPWRAACESGKSSASGGSVPTTSSKLREPPCACSWDSPSASVSVSLCPAPLPTKSRVAMIAARSAPTVGPLCLSLCVSLCLSFSATLEAPESGESSRKVRSNRVATLTTTAVTVSCERSPASLSAARARHTHTEGGGGGGGGGRLPLFLLLRLLPRFRSLYRSSGSVREQLPQAAAWGRSTASFR